MHLIKAQTCSFLTVIQDQVISLGIVAAVAFLKTQVKGFGCCRIISCVIPLCSRKSCGDTRWHQGRMTLVFFGPVLCKIHFPDLLF